MYDKSFFFFIFYVYVWYVYYVMYKVNDNVMFSFWLYFILIYLLNRECIVLDSLVR